MLIQMLINKFDNTIKNVSKNSSFPQVNCKHIPNTSNHSGDIELQNVSQILYIPYRALFYLSNFDYNVFGSFWYKSSHNFKKKIILQIPVIVSQNIYSVCINSAKFELNLIESYSYSTLNILILYIWSECKHITFV